MWLHEGLFKDLRAQREALEGKWKMQVGTKKAKEENTDRKSMLGCVFQGWKGSVQYCSVPAERGRVSLLFH